MHYINQLQDVDSHCLGNGSKYQIDCGSLSTNTPLYNSKNSISQKAFLNSIPKKRRSPRLQSKALNNMNKTTWKSSNKYAIPLRSSYTMATAITYCVQLKSISVANGGLDNLCNIHQVDLEKWYKLLLR